MDIYIISISHFFSITSDALMNTVVHTFSLEVKLLSVRNTDEKGCEMGLLLSQHGLKSQEDRHPDKQYNHKDH